MSRNTIFAVTGACLLGVGLLLVFVAPWGRPTPPTVIKPPPLSIPGRRALLVGVTKYDHPDLSTRSLSGPGNDVAQLRHVLTAYYGFPTDDVVCLAEAEQGPSRRPTRQNIEREFRQLAKVTQEGDQIFILITGHGDRQPESPPTNPEFRQADGISEIFLPADVRPAEGNPPRVPNAIVDVEFRVWLAEITKQKAYVWVVFDCCHSGDLSRGSEDVRELPPDVLVPATALEQARKAAALARGGSPPAEKPPPFHPHDDSDRLVALYACRPTEKTLEWAFPVAKGYQRHGILSYTLAEVLTAAVRDPTRLTYRDVLRRIELKYAARSGWAATPNLGGAGQHRFLFGENKPYIPQFQVTQTGGVYRVNAGDFHGLTSDSVLVVYTPGSTGLKPEIHGYARVVSTTPFESVVEPYTFAGRGKVDGLPRLATCDVERTAFKISPLRVAVVSTRAGEAAAGAVRDAIRKVAENHSPLIALHDNKEADWLIRCDAGRPALVDATGNRPPAPLPAADDPKFGEVLGTNLLRIYRAQSLIAVGDRLESERRGQTTKVDFELTMFRTRPGEKEEPVVPGRQDLAFFPGEGVKFQVRNTSEKETIDVALLIVGSDYRITSFYPGWRDEFGKDIEPGKLLEESLESKPYSDAPPFGPEYLVAIAVPAKKRVRFSALVQPGLKDRGYGDDSPLAQLLEHALDGFGTRSAMDRAVIAENAVRVVSWRTVPARKNP